MAKEQTIRGDWSIKNNDENYFVGRIETPKGFACIRQNGFFKKVTVKVSLKVIINGVDVGLWADLKSNDFLDVGLAQLFVEGLLL